MYKLAVIGDRDSVLGFRALGFEVFISEGLESAAEILDSLAEKDYAIIYITEQLMTGLGEVISKYDDRPVPAIIPIPGKAGTTGIGMKNVHKAVERAVGADILK